MAPLTSAIGVRFMRRTDTPHNPLICYSGAADPEWVIGSVPNGGYVLALIVQACLENQAGTAHPDPLHVSAQYLRPTNPSAIEVRVRILKRGRNFINIIADLVQRGRTCITAHLIFGKIPLSTGPVIDTSSGYSRRHPLHAHPSETAVSLMSNLAGFAHRVKWAPDPHFLSQNDSDSPDRHATTGGGLAVWGAWIELVDKDERLTPASLAFFADCVENMLTLFPSSVTGVDKNNLCVPLRFRPARTCHLLKDCAFSSWLPTLSLAVQWKAPTPRPSAMHSARTVGVYVVSGFPSPPQTRHDTFVEIWTAPSNIGEGPAVDGWRDSQVCLAIATQMQILVSGTQFEKAGAKL
ncbi:thioesterase-like superfamily-domain-containing protein [Mycena polygramma]|nr:thioesterase-like superfamily-domain-containing protein [Mycena polygramma]